MDRTSIDIQLRLLSAKTDDLANLLRRNMIRETDYLRRVKELSNIIRVLENVRYDDYDPH